MKEIEVKATNTRQKFICTSKDKIMDNGSCYQLITQSFWKDWSDNTPIISKTEFNRLFKLGVLSKPYSKKMSITVNIYDFTLED